MPIQNDREQPIRKARKKLGMTQAQLAPELEVTRATLSRYETGVIDVPVSIAWKVVHLMRDRKMRASLATLYPDPRSKEVTA